MDAETTLASLVESWSWSLFEILDVNTDWLQLNPDQWEKYNGFQEASEFVRSVKVVNDTAEEALRLCCKHNQEWRPATMVDSSCTRISTTIPKL